MADCTPKDCDTCEKGRTKKGCREVCYDAQVYRRYLDHACEQKFTATDIFYRYKDSIVTLNTYFMTSTGAQTPYLLTSGFFIRVGDQLYIIAPSFSVISPGGFYSSDFIVLPPAGTFFNSWFATVKNANLEGCNVIYQLSLVGVSGGNDVAVFKVDYDVPFNCKLRKLKHHPYLQWGSSRDTAIGSPVFVFDHATNLSLEDLPANLTPSTSARSITETTLGDNRYVDPAGRILYEGVSIGSTSLASYIGSPVMTNTGTVIGMITNTTGVIHSIIASSQLAGPSQNSMTPIIERIISGDKCFTVCEGGISRYLSPFPGVLPLGSTTVSLPPVLLVPQVMHLFGIDDLMVPAPGSDSIVPLLGTCYKAVQGYFLAGSPVLGNPYSVTLASDCPCPDPLVPAPVPLFGAGDIIYGVDCCILGSFPPQVSWYTALANIAPNCPVKINYVLRSECYACEHKACVVFKPYPPATDLPTLDISSIFEPPTE